MRTLFFTIIGITLLTACGSKEDNPLPTPPTPAILLFPEKDAECNQGEIIDQNTSTITFEWEPSKGADSFTLTIRDLISNRIETYTTSATFKEVTLNRNTPYSWFINAINIKSGESVSSNLWKFYNAGEGTLSYPPFPADLITPASGTTAYSASNIELSWEAADVDSDIDQYIIYLDTNNPPTTVIASNITEEKYTLTPLNPDVYYWKVLTTDALGNSTPSPVGEFKVE